MNVGTYAFAQLLRVLPRARITRTVGKLCDVDLPPWLSKTVVSAYVKAYDVNMTEAAAITSETYGTFDEFFTRQLAVGSRDVAKGLCSPADGRLDAVGRVEKGGTVQVKGRPYRVVDLVGEALADRYQGSESHFGVVYLSPANYHRVHTPISGELTAIHSFPGDLFPVNRISEEHIPDFLVRNRRVALEVSSPEHGRVAVVMVAAMIVGRITVTGIEDWDVPFGRHEVSIPLTRGDELGIFHLGSTAVVLTERASLNRPLGPVLMGESLMDRSEPTTS